MSAYVIVEVSVHDMAAYEEYKNRTPATIAAYDGKFIVRGGSVVTLEGAWAPERMVVLQFPSVERAQQWWRSEKYSEAREIRQLAAKTKMIIVAGI